MSSERGVLVTFTRPAQAARAIRALRDAGYEVRVAMPAPYPDVVAALGRPRSPVGYLALPGAAFGIGCGLALTVATSLAWPLVTGGKPVVSLPAFVVITFELSILLGALGNLLGVAIGTWRGGRARAFPAGAVCADCIGVFASGADPAAAVPIVRALGAEVISLVA